MTRRRFVALVSASVILAAVLAVVGTVLTVTQTDFGRERIRRLVAARLSAGLRGKAHIYVGRLSGPLFTALAVDSFAIWDDEDSLVIATGPVRVTYDPRDLIDQRLRFHSVDIARPNINLRRHADDVWNYHRIFRPGPPTPKVRVRARSFGDVILADSVLLHEGTFLLTEAWQPDDSLRGARRDSAVRAAMAKPWPDVRMTSEGPKRTRRFTHLRIDAPWVRIAHPDSAGQRIRLGELDVQLNDPPADLRRLRGDVRIRGDTVWADLAHFALPASEGKATVHVWWGDGRPARVDVHAIADTVSLSDFSWVYPYLPRAGGGRTEVFVHNDPKDLGAMEFALREMDLRTVKSRLRGAMTFVTGWPVLGLTDVDVRLEPADFDLIRAFSGGYSAVDFQGRFTGRIQARGGRIDRWQVDSADLTYQDYHVPGAVSHLTASGELDLLHPSEAKFHGFDVTLSALDLRTVEFLFPSFPRLHGTIEGSTTLDSVWDDVRFSDADLYHYDGPDLATHATGAGRVTTSGRNTFLDVTMQADPVSFTTLARSYPGIILRGPFTGPVRAVGTADGLALTTRLAGAAGTLTIDETIDTDTLGGIGARGTVRGEAIDARRLTERDALPATRLFVAMTNDVHGDSLANLVGDIHMTVDTSHVADIWVPHGEARITMAEGHLRVDSIMLASTGVRARASGMLGLAAGRKDTLRFTVDIDSLGGLRSLIAPEDTATRHGALLARVHRDSLAGSVTASGWLAGSVADSFTANAVFLGERMVMGATTAARVAGGVDVAGLPKAPGGSVWVRLDSAVVAGAGLDTVHLVLSLAGADSGSLLAAAASDRKGGTLRARMRASYGLAGDTTRVTLDTLALVAGGHPWTLAAPAHFRRDPGGDALDSLVVRATGGGLFTARWSLPQAGPVSGHVIADSLPLDDVGAIAQTAEPMDGLFTGDLRVSGTRALPAWKLSGRFRGARYGTILLPYFSLDADYVPRTLALRVGLYDRQQQLATLALSVPADLSLTAVPERFPDEPIHGRFTADSVDLTAFTSFSPLLAQPEGVASTDLAIGGTLRRPEFTGRLRVTDGAFGLPRFGVRLTAVHAGVDFTPGGFRIDSLTAQSGTKKGNYVALRGTVRAPVFYDLLSDRRADTVDLTMRARDFQLIDSRRLARLEVTDDIRLSGPFLGLTLTGTIDVEKADFYLSAFASKSTAIDLDDPELFQDSVVLAAQVPASAIPADVREAMRNLQVKDLEISVGDNVWLRSDQADIKLGGAVQISGSGTQRLVGKIDVKRGTYRLEAGPVQRSFTVDSGSVSFYGDADRSGALNVWASSTVRQANRQGEDVKIMAHIEGTTTAPKLSFTSSERVPLSQAEIFSYLFFGQATPNDVNNATALSRSVTASLGPLMESVLAGQLKWVDQITIQTGNSAANSQAQSDALSVLAGSRFGVGKQIGDNTYVSANAGLCWLQSSAASSSFSQSLAVSVEQRVSTRYFLMASMEPSSASLLCKPGTTDIGSHPKQYGLDIFRDWSF